MTGYGAASGQIAGTSLAVEVRSVNQRHLDIKINGPREYAAREAELRRRIGRSVSRGRVDVYVGRAAQSRGAGVELQPEVAKAYMSAWKKLKRDLRLKGDLDLSLFQGRTDIFRSVEPSCDLKAEGSLLDRLLDRALRAHTAERKREGAHLKRDIQARLGKLKGLVRRLKTKSRTVTPRLQQRLNNRVNKLLGSDAIDPARVAQEVAILVDRCDVTEELVRLESHLSGLAKLVRSGGPVGKRFDFLLQEVSRELNTIASKASDIGVTELVIEGKTEMEKLREQIQNVE